jgi:hypothetical protein
MDIQIFPMNNQMLGAGPLEHVNVGQFFRQDVCQGGRPHHPIPGRFNYASLGVKVRADHWLVFQYKGQLVAHAKLKEKRQADGHSDATSHGYFILDPTSVKVYRVPITTTALSKLWPGLVLNQRRHLCLQANVAGVFRFLVNRP